MDVPFDVEAWQPTDNVPEEVDVALLSVQLSIDTKEIQRHPYDPSRWTDRARTLGKLCYPELAVGDYWKAEELCRQMLQRMRRDNTQWQLGFHRGFWMQAEDDEVNTDGALKRQHVLTQILESIITEAHEGTQPYMNRSPYSYEGLHLRRPFPWMSEKHRVRQDVLVEHINYEIAVNIASQQAGEPLCEVRRNALDLSFTGKDGSDILGMFASRTIEKGEIILRDHTNVWGCNGPSDQGGRRRHEADGCCHEIAMALGGKRVQLDLQSIRERCRPGDARDTLLLCRLLLSILRDDPSTHPLEHPFAARLTPMYHRRRKHVFSREEDIAIPLTALQQCGVDIYADAGGIYDTWVLFELDARIANNRCGDPNSSKLFPLFSLFNHNCEHNTSWGCSRRGRDLKISAYRRIEKGEQLFVEYDAFAENASLEERRKTLRTWFDGSCRCSRCMREEREQEEAAAAAKAMVGRDTDDSLDGRVDSMHTWDTDVKPILPEDLCLKTVVSLDSA